MSNINNSQEIIIPKAIIEQYGFEEKVNLDVKDNCLIISSRSHNHCQGWE